MNYLSFQQTYRLLIFEHCLGEIIYLFIVVPWVLFVKGEGGGKKEGFVPSIREI